MKRCQVCNQEYVADVKVCDCVEAMPGNPAVGQDRYIGTVVDGRFKVLARLALGRMGTVYLAEQTDNQKKVALKILAPQFAADPEYVKEFCHAARLAAGLKHPNIATLLDFDQTSDGCLFVASDYVEGEPLDRVIEDAGRLDMRRAIEFGEQIADGLAAAHRRGLLHKDLRPCNIMVSADSQIRITDCGLPRPQKKGLSTDSSQANGGLAIPEYTAPEQASGGESTEQTDVYRLGLVLYEMLTGQVPFREATHLSTLLAQINDAPRPLRTLRREIPAGLEALVMQALEKKPAKRQMSMVRLAKDLRACGKALDELPKAPTVVHPPIAIPTASPTAPARAPRQSVGWRAAAAAGLGMAAFVGYLGFFWESVPTPTNSIAQPRLPHLPNREMAAPANEPRPTGVAIPAGPTDNEALKDQAPLAKPTAEQKPLVLAAKLPPPLNVEKPAPEKKVIVEAPRPVEPKPASQTLPAASPPPLPQVQPQAPQVARVDEKDLARLHSQIEQRLRNLGLLKVSDSDRWGVTVDANASGVVTLRGSLRDQRLRDEAIRVARDVSGVTDVRTNINLQFAPEGN